MPQVHPVPLALVGVSPAGNVSVTVAVPLLAAVPLFAAVSVYVPVPPCVKFPVCDLVSVRSGALTPVPLWKKSTEAVKAGDGLPELPPYTPTLFTVKACVNDPALVNV